MRIFRKRERSFALGGFLARSLMVLLMLGFLIYGVQSAAESSNAEGARILNDSLRRASVQCYALQGFYPPGIRYLEEELGVQIDHDKYSVFYEGFASNMMPDITVILKA